MAFDEIISAIIMFSIQSFFKQFTIFLEKKMFPFGSVLDPFSGNANKIEHQVDAAVGRYRAFLNKTLLFTNTTHANVMRAESLRHLCEVVRIDTLQALNEDVRSLINELRNLESEIRAKAGPDMSALWLVGVIKQMVGMDENNVLLIGRKMQKNLLAINQQQHKIEGIHVGINGLRNRSHEQDMRIVRDQKLEFQAILEETRAEVNRGFEIIS